MPRTFACVLDDRQHHCIFTVLCTLPLPPEKVLYFLQPINMGTVEGGDVKLSQIHHSFPGDFTSLNLRTNMAFQVKVEYGGNRFATFLVENVVYEGLFCSINKFSASFAHYTKIRSDFVNVTRTAI